MRTVILLIFILVMLPAVITDIDWGECIKSMVCYVDPTCVKKQANKLEFLIDAHFDKLNRSCERYIAIRPKSDKEWEVSMSDSKATEIKFEMASTTIFKCNSSQASTDMTNDLNISLYPIIKGPGVQCSFNTSVVAVGKNDFNSVLTNKKLLKFSNGNDHWDMKLTNDDIQDKINCPAVTQDISCASDELCEKPDQFGQPAKISCKRYDLLYQYNQTDWNVSNTLYCNGGKFYSVPGDIHVPDEDIIVKCVQKKCRQCTDPNISAKFEKPDQYDECAYLHCDTPRMIINGNITHSDSTLTCSDSKWKVDNAELDIRNDCEQFVELLPFADKPESNQYMQPFVSDDLVVSCKPNYQMEFVDGATSTDQLVSHISCDFETGLWTIKDEKNQDITPPTRAFKARCFRPSTTEAPGLSSETIVIIVVSCVFGVLILSIASIYLLWIKKMKPAAKPKIRQKKEGSKQV